MAVWRSFDISRVQRAEGRRRDRAEVPRVPRAPRAQDRVADPPAPLRLRALGSPGVRRPLAAGGRARRSATSSGTPTGSALGEAKRIFTNSRNVADRLWSSLRVTGEVLYHPSPATEALLATRARPSYGDYIFYPSRLEVAQAPVARDRGDAARARRRSSSSWSGGVPTSGRSASRSGGLGLGRPGPVGDRRLRTSGCTSSTSARSACSSGRSTRTTATSRSRGWRRARPVVTADRQPAGRSSSSRTARRGSSPSPSRGRSPRRSTGSGRDRDAAARLGRAGNALVRETRARRGPRSSRGCSD